MQETFCSCSLSDCVQGLQSYRIPLFRAACESRSGGPDESSQAYMAKWRQEQGLWKKGEINSYLQNLCYH